MTLTNKVTPTKIMNKIADISDIVDQNLMQKYPYMPKYKRKKIDKLYTQFVDELRLALCKFTDIYNYMQGDLPDEMV